MNFPLMLLFVQLSQQYLQSIFIFVRQGSAVLLGREGRVGIRLWLYGGCRFAAEIVKGHCLAGNLEWTNWCVSKHMRKRILNRSAERLRRSTIKSRQLEIAEGLLNGMETASFNTLLKSLKQCSSVFANYDYKCTGALHDIEMGHGVICDDVKETLPTSMKYGYRYDSFRNIWYAWLFYI